MQAWKSGVAINFAKYFQIHASCIGLALVFGIGLYKAYGISNEKVMADKKNNRDSFKYLYIDEGGCTIQSSQVWVVTTQYYPNSRMKKEESKIGTSNDLNTKEYIKTNHLSIFIFSCLLLKYFSSQSSPRTSALPFLFDRIFSALLSNIRYFLI